MDNFKITKTILENINEQNERINECVDIVNGYTTDEETRVNQEIQRQENELRREEQYNNIENRFNEINTQLDNIEIETTALRPYKNKNINLGFNAYWGDRGEDGRPIWVASKSQIDNQLNLIKDMVNQCTLVIHISYVKDINSFIILENLENLLYAVDSARDKGIETVCLKFHCQMEKETIKTFGKEAFFADYKAKLENVMEMFKNKNIKYAVAFNELNHIYTNDDYKENVKDIIQTVKNKGYKALITTNDMWDFNTLSDDIIELLDAYSVNLYPNISPKGINTTYSDCVYAWNKYTYFLKYLKSLGKEVIVSEFGCADNWLALNSTGSWSFDSAYKSYGGAPAKLIYGFLNSNIVNYIDSAWLWYYTNFYNYDEPKNILINYMKGGK